MATIRISTKQIQAIQIEDKKTWPVDLDVWVDISAHHNHKEWDAPFYLKPDQIKVFKQIIQGIVSKRQAEKARRERSNRRTFC
jgi:hypothetical protein